MLTASRLLVAVTARSLAAVEEHLTLPQFRMLVVLESRGPTSLSSLARQLDVNPSTALRMRDRLTTAGMVEQSGNPASRREVTLMLSASGHRVVRDATARRRAEIARIVAAMPEQSRSGLVTALRAFTDAGGEPRADDVPGLDRLG